MDNIRLDLWVEGVYIFLMAKTEGKRPLGRPRRIWVHNIRMNLWGDGGLKGIVAETGGKEATGET